MDNSRSRSVAPSHTYRLHSERDGCDGQPTSPSTATGAVITCMESLLESILDRLSQGQEISICWISRRSLRGCDGGRQQEIRFPGRSLSEGQKFGMNSWQARGATHCAVSHIVQLAYSSSCSYPTMLWSPEPFSQNGVYNATRQRLKPTLMQWHSISNIFYQHQDLFDKQRVVDELVDDLALTLGVNRDDLNIVSRSTRILAVILIRPGCIGKRSCPRTTDHSTTRRWRANRCISGRHGSSVYLR